MKITAAVSRESNAPFALESLEISSPKDDEILVRVVATGVCHTDIVARDALVPTPKPVVLGHEGAGVVEKVGSKVTKVKVGDHVVMSFNSCGHCPSCEEHEPAYCYEFFPRNFFAKREDGSTSLSKGDETIYSNFFGQSSFATHAICHERNVVRVPDTAPLELLGPLACGIQTGAGAVLKALKVTKGSSFAVFGTGAVGLSAILAAKVAGAKDIVAVDLNTERLEFAKTLGATFTINSGQQDAKKTLLELTNGGLRFALDTTGIAAVIRTAVESLAPRGVCGILGASASDSEITFDETQFMSGGRHLMGIVEGSSNPDEFIPELIQYYNDGKFPFDKLVKFYPFEAINEAVADSEKGITIKPIVRIAR